MGKTHKEKNALKKHVPIHNILGEKTPQKKILHDVFVPGKKSIKNCMCMQFLMLFFQAQKRHAKCMCEGGLEAGNFLDIFLHVFCKCI